MTTSSTYLDAKEVLKQVDENIAELQEMPDALAFLRSVRPFVAAAQPGTARSAIKHFTNLLNTYIEAYPDNEALVKLRDVGLPVVVRQVEATL